MDGGSNGAIFDSNKFNMAAAAILVNFEWPYLRNGSRSTYIARMRAVIFAIAQLSCYVLTVTLLLKDKSIICANSSSQETGEFWGTNDINMLDFTQD